MRTILITGVAGVGKSTLTGLIATKLDLPHHDLADLMLAADTTVTGKDDLERTDWRRRQRIYAAVDQVLDDWFGPANTDDACVLLENHLTVINGDTLQAFPITSWDRYNPAGLINVAADATMIHQRRNRDTTRKRRTHPVDLIAAQQRENALQADAIAEHLGISVLHLTNDDTAAATDTACTWMEPLL